MGILRTDRVTGLGGANAIKGSVYFPHDGDVSAGESGALQIQNENDALTFGTGDWTIEFWFYANRVGVVQTLFDNRGTGAGTNTAVLIRISDSNNIQFFTTNAFRITGSTTIIKNAWHHVALTRTGSTHTLYVNGSSDGTYSNSGMDYIGPVNSFAIIGSDDNRDGRYGLNGFVSNLRVAKELIYSAAFTVPTTALTPTSNTTLLCCQSSGNVNASFGDCILTAFASNTNSRGPEASRFTPNSPVGFSTTTDVGTQFGSTFDGVTTFDSQAYMVPPGGNTRERNRGRGLVGGGYSPSVLGQIYSVEIASDGTSADFGDLTLARRGTGAAASHTRGVWAGGYAPGYQDRIDFVTIATTANAIDFGNLDTGRFESSGVGNDTRGVFGPCENPATSQNVIQFITFATTGNATDFGDSTVQTKKQASMNSTTRGLFAGGQNVPSPSAYYDIIDKITIATTGNAADFGDLTQNVFMCTGVSDSTRGIRGGGAKSPSPANTDTMDFVTIASDGNATDFGNLTTDNQRSGGMSNSVRGLFAGGATPNSSTAVNSIDKITIQTTGNAVDFGDYPAYTGSGLSAVTQAAGCSDSHGGLS